MLPVGFQWPEGSALLLLAAGSDTSAFLKRLVRPACAIRKGPREQPEALHASTALNFNTRICKQLSAFTWTANWEEAGRAGPVPLPGSSRPLVHTPPHSILSTCLLDISLDLAPWPPPPVIPKLQECGQTPNIPLAPPKQTLSQGLWPHRIL